MAKCPHCNRNLSHLHFHIVATDLSVGVFVIEGYRYQVCDNSRLEKYLCPFCHGIIALTFEKAKQFLSN